MALWVHRFAHTLTDKAIWGIVYTLPAFVFNGLALNFEFFLRDGIEQKAHAVCFQP